MVPTWRDNYDIAAEARRKETYERFDVPDILVRHQSEVQMIQGIQTSPLTFGYLSK